MSKRRDSKKVTRAKSRVKRTSPEEVQARINRRTGVLVAAMVRELSAIRKMLSLEKNAHYVAFRELKRKLYRLYPGQPDKAKAICNFALVRSGWASRVQ